MSVFRRILVASLALLAVTCGCRHEPQSTPSTGDADEHAGHVIPAHKPKSFPDAVRALKDLHGKMADQATHASTVPIVLDIATWLPEIAAESDMPEGPWKEVNTRSEALVAIYRADANNATSRDDAAKQIASLEVLLAKADPRWFDKTVGLGTPP